MKEFEDTYKHHQNESDAMQGVDADAIWAAVETELDAGAAKGGFNWKLGGFLLGAVVVAGLLFWNWGSLVDDKAIAETVELEDKNATQKQETASAKGQENLRKDEQERRDIENKNENDEMHITDASVQTAEESTREANETLRDGGTRSTTEEVGNADAEVTNPSLADQDEGEENGNVSDGLSQNDALSDDAKQQESKGQVEDINDAANIGTGQELNESDQAQYEGTEDGLDRQNDTENDMAESLPFTDGKPAGEGNAVEQDIKNDQLADGDAGQNGSSSEANSNAANESTAEISSEDEGGRKENVEAGTAGGNGIPTSRTSEHEEHVLTLALLPKLAINEVENSVATPTLRSLERNNYIPKKWKWDGIYVGLGTGSTVHQYFPSSDANQQSDLLNGSSTADFGQQLNLRSTLLYQNKLRVSVGVEMQQAYERFDASLNSDTTIVLPNQVIGFEEDTTGQITPILGDQEVNAITTRTIRQFNQFQMLSIPLTVGYQQRHKRWTFGVDAGVQYNRFLLQRGKTISANAELAAFDSKKDQSALPKQSFAWRAQPFVQYGLSERLYVRGEFSYQQTFRQAISLQGAERSMRFVGGGIGVGMRF